jgi:hypothetical protein
MGTPLGKTQQGLASLVGCSRRSIQAIESGRLDRNNPRREGEVVLLEESNSDHCYDEPI